AERGKTGRSMSPTAAMICPSSSTTAMAPRCRFSTQLPRTASTKTGFASIKQNSGPGCLANSTGPEKSTWRRRSGENRGLKVPVFDLCQVPRIHPALEAAALDEAPVGTARDDVAALDPDGGVRLDLTDLLRIARRPFTHVEVVPPGDAGNARRLLDMVAGSHGWLDGKGRGGGD